MIRARPLINNDSTQQPEDSYHNCRTPHDVSFTAMVEELFPVGSADVLKRPRTDGSQVRSGIAGNVAYRFMSCMFPLLISLVVAGGHSGELSNKTLLLELQYKTEELSRSQSENNDLKKQNYELQLTVKTLRGQLEKKTNNDKSKEMEVWSLDNIAFPFLVYPK